ncbi:hypothetical protein Agub_g10205 [Astrephomene gubernaculifera]|uniref:Protein kinase domain-containing protein n=1 Tax=Astrephomene gubernaculifera TaxID=47775 RepID=A0AAD3HPS0_9CHLO|nr:hypothetical protein Agub_g10205 [Astrephomene gubernaculifera]
MAELPRFSAPHPLGLPANRYSHPVRVLGKGAFGEVYLCFIRKEHPNGVQYEPVAVKIYQPIQPGNERMLEMLRREVECQGSLHHPHVISLREVGITGVADRIYLNLEFADSGTLKQLLAARGGRLTEGEARWYTQQLVYGMAYCHAQGVFNRDIKPDNLLLHRGGLTWPLLKVSDFGLCKSTGHSAPHSLVGSLHYMAPEVIIRVVSSSGNGDNEKYDGRKVDVFSCGIVLYQMIFGALPFNRAPDGRPLEYKYREDRETFLDNMRLDRWTQLIPRSVLAPPPAPAGGGGGGQDEALQKQGGQQQPQQQQQLPPVHLNPALIDLLSGMLRYDAAQRMTLRDVMMHPWYCYGLPAEYHAMLLKAGTEARPAGEVRRSQTKEEIAEIFARLSRRLGSQNAAAAAAVCSDDDDAEAY